MAKDWCRSTGANWAAFPLRGWLPLAGSLLLPMVSLSIYLWFTRSALPNDGRFDSEAVWVAAALGVACIAFMPLRPVWRISLCIIYLPTTVFLLFMYALLFVGNVYDNWL